MTREEAQSLAEQLVQDAAREGHWLDFHAAGNAFASGVVAFANGMQRGEQIHTSTVVYLAASCLELLRESFLQVGGTEEEIRADHEAHTRRGRPSN